MVSWRQTKLVLWKDYLIRKRKLVSVGGAVWATVVMLSLVLVRKNIDTQDFSTCQYPARALPSAGMLKFLQSFICTINNECLPIDQYDEIPTYANSRLSQLERQFSPLIYNETILDLAGVMPDALRLVATFTDVIDQPDFHVIARNGVHVEDLFINPSRVKKHLVKQLNLTDAAASDVMAAEINFQGIFSSSFDKCVPDSLSSILVVKNTSTLAEVSYGVCNKTDQEMEHVVTQLLLEINYRKYFKMIGDMLSRLNSGQVGWKQSVNVWGGMASALLRLTNFESYIPTEMAVLLNEDNAPLFNITIISAAMDLFKPTFGDTDIYKTIRGITDAIVDSIKWIYQLLQRPAKNRGPEKTLKDAVSLVFQGMQIGKDSTDFFDGFDKLKNNIDNSIEIAAELTESVELSPDIVMKALTRITSAIIEVLPKRTQHEVLYYSTLLTKLIEGAHQTALKNIHMEEIMYNVTRRQPAGVKILRELPPYIIGKLFDALADAERTQIFTSKLTNPGQMFCDASKLANFFRISKGDAESLKKQLCNTEWRSYISDIVTSFGIFDVKANINKMASLVISETVGKDNSESLYTIDKDFKELQSLVEDLTEDQECVSLDWPALLNMSSDADLFKTITSKMPLAKKILITVHGALAREVVKQNPILEAKITPILIRATDLVTALNSELQTYPKSLVDGFKLNYPDIAVTVLKTLANHDKTFKALSTPTSDILCNGVDNSLTYLELPNDKNGTAVVSTLCLLSQQFDRTLDGESRFAAALHTALKGHLNPLQDVHWVALSTQLKNLYSRLEKDFPYVLSPFKYNMDDETVLLVGRIANETKSVWFSSKNLGAALHLSIKMGFRALDLMDRKLFNMTAETPKWLDMKHSVDNANSVLVITNQLVRLVSASLSDEDYEIPELTVTVKAAKNLIPNLPSFVRDVADVLISDNTNMTDVVAILNSSPPWPCTERSLSLVLSLSSEGAKALIGLESLLCAGTELREEWGKYAHAQKIRNFVTSTNGTTTEFEPHVFLKFSANFDEFINDLNRLDRALRNTRGVPNESNPGIIESVKYAIGAFKDNNVNYSLYRKIFANVDTALEEIDTSVNDTIATLNIWERYIKCSNISSIDSECEAYGRAAWKYTLKFLSVAAHSVIGDLTKYFTEVNEPNVNLLQLMGFVSGTGLSKVYEKWPDFLGVLLNSYWDYGFMNQIRRSSKTQFWDCDSVVNALVIPTGSRISEADIRSVKPYVCPSVFYWISLPRGENVMLDLIAKTQYYFNTLPANNLTSSYIKALDSTIKFSKLITDFTNVNITAAVINETVESKFDTVINNLLSWKISENDSTYILFNEVNRKQFLSTIYLIKVATAVNKISEAVSKVNASDLTTEEIKEVTEFTKLIKRRPTALMEIYFDAISNLLWTSDNSYGINEAFDTMCDNLNNNITNKNILSDNKVVKSHFCSKNYRAVHDRIEDVFDLENSKKALVNFVEGLQKGTQIENTDMYKFFSERKELVKIMKLSMQYSEDLGVGVYIKYLQSNLQHYNIVLRFLAGDDWWTSLKELYSGPMASQFFDSVEHCFEIAEDIVNHLDKIKLVRLLRDVNVNNTDAFCLNNLTLSDYIPDGTGTLSRIKREMCNPERGELFKELPPLMFASQGYDSDLQLSKEVNYTALDEDIAKTQEKLDTLRDGPKAPQWPSWLTDQKLQQFKRVVKNVFSKETLTKISFGLMYNIVDGVTLFKNISNTVVSSTMTAWLRQVDLQLFKKDEYDSLLCHISEMPIHDIYNTLRTNFHWDMAFKELISERNYTIYEFNKAMNQFLEHLSTHVLHSMSSNHSRLMECRIEELGKNVLGNVSFHTSIVAKTLRMIRSAMPHLAEIEGIKKSRVFMKLSREIAHRLSVIGRLDDAVVGGNDLENYLEQNWNGLRLNSIEVDLSKIVNHTTIPIQSWATINSGDMNSLCNENDCSKLSMMISRHLNMTQLKKKLPELQMAEFWKMRWLSDIIEHLESLLIHAERMLAVGSWLDLEGVMQGHMRPLLDVLLTILQKENLKSIINSLNGIIEELHPLLKGTTLEFELQSVSNGLKGLGLFRDSIVEDNDLSVDVWRVISTPDALESEMRMLGINHTNFWSVAASRIHSGKIDFKPLLMSKERSIHIQDYVCQPALAAQVLKPSDLDSVTPEDVYRAVAEQFCTLDDDQVRRLIPAVMKSLNVTYIFNQVLDVVLLEVYEASNLTQEEGKRVMSKYQDMLALMPLVQENLGQVSKILAKEPMLAALKNADSVKELLSSAEFLSSAGKMLCGKPLVTDNNRFYKAIAETKDFSTEPDPRQLEALPSNFCRSLYKDILSIGGGKIVWSFVKPLIMGRILYTPSTPVVENIVHKANESFAQMSRMRDLVSGFAEAFDSIDTFTEHKESLVTLRQVMNSARFHSLVDSFGGGDGLQESGNVDFAKVLDELGDVKNMSGLVKRLSDLLECLNLNRFQPMADELRLSNEAVKLTMVNEFSAGIVFNSEPDLDNNIDYKIRMDIESIPTTSRKRNQFWTPGPEANFLENMRYFRGFIQVQDMIDKAIIQTAVNSSRRVRRDVNAPARQSEDEWAVYTQQMPYPCYRRDVFQASLYESQALIVALFFSLILTVSSAVRFTIHERESGNTTLMSVMGLKISNHTVSWFISSLVETAVASTLMLLVLKLGGVLPRSDSTLLWLMLVNFSFSVVTFCYMCSKLFKSASLGSVCTCILFLMMFMPYVIVLSMEAVLSTAEKVITSISMCTAFSYSLLYLARYEAIGVGAQWDNVWVSPESGDSMSIAVTSVIVLADAALYTLVGWFIEWYTEYRNRTDNLVNSTTSSEKAGISIINVSKMYGEGTRRERLALNNVSIELNRGQITTLLGQNGAGKTTLIKIITGMLKPSKGSIVIRTEDNEKSRVKLGVCPQNDVLIENMTAVEHLQFYAMLKSGLRYEDVELEVQNMLHVLSFGGLAHERVNRLSGGLRRRLCVSLAFISQPQLVLLDEPSSGVDPVARRDTWSLIVKLKEDRTVLMTTHHLDEAELLSDQIVIMHKGQVHTTGTPIEIKRSLGNGYKLTAFYTKPKPKLETIDDESKKTAIEELSKDLLAAVRGVVKNAQLSEVKGKEVEIVMPFFDSNGLNNDFLRLCQTLDAKQSSLGFSRYSMDCSSLEQVFLSICQHADAKPLSLPDLECEASSSTWSNDNHTVSTNSVKEDDTSLVPDNGRARGTHLEQYIALLHKRWMHYTRNWWLLTLLFVVPTVFVFVAMGFSLIRPPADNEVALKLHPSLYEGSTEFLVPKPSNSSRNMDPKFAEDVMSLVGDSVPASIWSEKDNPECQCTQLRQECATGLQNGTLPDLLRLPDSRTALDWLTTTQEMYIEKRYGGWSSSLENNKSNLIAWYNNKGHHAMPAYVNALSTATLRRVTGNTGATITTYTHPLKISEEQLSKSTLLQHVADIGIAAVILVGFSLIPAGSAIYLVHERCGQQKRLQMLCGVSPLTYWMASLTWDMLVIVLNIGLTVCVLEIFQLPVFVEKDNLAAICLLLLLFGWACGTSVHVFEKCFTDPSLANMIIFCLNVFVGVSGLAVLLILDIISDSDMTDNARWTLHKIFMLSPQFALGDGLIEIAKNSIQAQVLKRFGMDTYNSPLTGGLVAYHYTALILVGLLMFFVNMAIECDWIDDLIDRWRSPTAPPDESEMEDLDVATERYRVELAAMRATSVARPTNVRTIGNINAGFVNTEGKVLKGSLKLSAAAGDVLQCISLRKEYNSVSGKRIALHSLTLGVPPGECLALLGENGAGKSTTFGLLTGELRPTAGDILLGGQRVNRAGLRTGLISYCPQNDAIDPLITVREQLRFYCCLRGISSQDEVINRTLDMFDLKRYSEQRTSTLSGGNKRKLCTAVAMMGRSALVLLDEPTSGMDPSARRVVSRGVGAACAAGRGVVLSTHALEDARAAAGALALLGGGRLRAVGAVERALERFGGGHVVGARVSRGGSVRRVWEGLRARLPHARLQAAHYTTLQVYLPKTTVPEGEQDCTLSRIFSELAALQAEYDIEDFTVNTSTLYQMFDNFADKKEDSTLNLSTSSNGLTHDTRDGEELITVTSL